MGGKTYFRLDSKMAAQIAGCVRRAVIGIGTKTMLDAHLWIQGPQQFHFSSAKTVCFISNEPLPLNFYA